MAYFLRNIQASRVNNWRVFKIKNAKFSGYCFYMNTNITDLQICISVPSNQIDQKQPPKVWKVVLRNFTKFTGKHLCQSLFFSKVACLCNFIKKDFGTGVFLWILRNYSEHLFYRTFLGDCFLLIWFETQNITFRLMTRVNYTIFATASIQLRKIDLKNDPSYNHFLNMHNQVFFLPQVKRCAITYKDGILIN